jgi:hypothetical protein
MSMNDGEFGCDLPLVDAEFGLAADTGRPGVADSLVAEAFQQVQARLEAVRRAGSSAGWSRRAWLAMPFVSVLHPVAEPVLLNEEAVARGQFEEPNWFADWLLGHGRQQGLEEKDSRHVGLFHPARSSRYEFDLMAAQLHRRGRTSVVLQP